jgi:signal transduction histidine kinase
VRAQLNALRAAADGRTARIVCQVFDENDGLPRADFISSRQPVCALDAQGRLWFATTKGVVMADPASLALNDAPPPVYVEGISFYRPAGSGANGAVGRQSSEEILSQLRGPFKGRLSLPAGSRRIEVHYSALSYVAPEKMRFQVKLEPGDADWHELGGRRVAYFYDLLPQDYVFRVRAANNDSVWNLTGASLAFTVQPFFWETWWFRVVALATLASLGGVAGWRHRHMKQLRVLAELEQNLRHQADLAHVARVSTLGELASSLAHELNQPLGAIMRNAEAGELFLQDPSPDLDELRALLADIRKDDQRAGAVIDRMRGLIKRRESERTLLDLNLLAGEVFSLVRFEAETRRVELTLEIAPGLPSVQGDRVQLQQVLLNLLLNAMDAVSGNPLVRRLVSMGARLVGERVEVNVSDNGHGISAENLRRVFEPFFTSKPNGLGLGLPISRGIIEAHGGRLWVENNPTGGTTFRFSLPVAKGGVRGISDP